MDTGSTYNRKGQRVISPGGKGVAEKKGIGGCPSWNGSEGEKKGGVSRMGRWRGEFQNRKKLKLQPAGVVHKK